MSWLSDFILKVQDFFRPTEDPIDQVIVTDKTKSYNTLPTTLSHIPLCGLALIKQFEGCKLVAYHDQASILTIGYGRTLHVKEGDRCTQAMADDWLAQDCTNAWAAILRNVKVPLTANQGGALLSWTYNLGVGTLEKSTLLTILNSGNYQGVPAQINKFIDITLPGGVHRVDKGLVNRRAAEAALWVGSDWRQA